MRGLTFLIFTFLTVCCWGLYGPILHLGQESMAGEDGQLARFKPFMAVGFAYFMIAVLYPATVLFTKGETGHWNVGGFIWSFIAGGIGALGALGIILAFNYGGKPVFVMPLVFGCAPVINTFVTMLMSKTLKEASWIFYIGILVVAIGAAGVLVFKPNEKKVDGSNGAQVTQNSDDGSAGSADEGKGESSGSKSAKPGFARKAETWFLMMLAIVMTAFCWGAYGPVLHRGQIKMGGSKLRPFLCVGLAYFVIAVLVPIPMLNSDPGNLTFMGSTWSLLAGTAGAFGALGIIYAFNFGGRPIYVMPLVFGLAPVINTMSTTVAKGLWGEIGIWFNISLALVILGAVTVLITAPRPKVKPKLDPGKPPKDDPGPADTASTSSKTKPAQSTFGKTESDAIESTKKVEEPVANEANSADEDSNQRQASDDGDPEKKDG